MIPYEKKIPNTPMPVDTKNNCFTDEPMVDLAEWFSNKIYIETVYHNIGIAGSTKRCFVRKSVAKKLETAITMLPDNLTFKVLDGWRPLAVQKELYEKHFELIQKHNPTWDIARIKKEVAKYVSKPNPDIENPAVHSTGGAIDVTLVHKDTAHEINMGTAFDDFSPMSYTAAFENEKDNDVRKNRRLLYWTMINAGFTNLPSEWWHYDYGDSFWSYYKNQPAIYCGIQKGEDING